METKKIKFFWNGIKVNGGKLIKCYYNLDNAQSTDAPTVTIMADSYGSSLPKDIFEVRNNSDSYTDYYEKDSTVLTPSHPLYPYARTAALNAEIRSSRKHLEYLQAREKNAPPDSRAFYREEAEMTANRLQKYEAERSELGKVGDPTADDMKAIDAMNLAAQNAQAERKKAEGQKEHEYYLQLRSEGRKFIEKTAQEYPVYPNQVQVVVHWSEYPGFLPWSNTNLVLSPAAAEIIFKHFDSTVEEGTGYYKTDFSVAGEFFEYEGRYDIGADAGGLIAHIREVGQHMIDQGDNQAPEVLALADEMARSVEFSKSSLKLLPDNDKAHTPGRLELMLSTQEKELPILQTDMER